MLHPEIALGRNRIPDSGKGSRPLGLFVDKSEIRQVAGTELGRSSTKKIGSIHLGTTVGTDHVFALSKRGFKLNPFVFTLKGGMIRAGLEEGATVECCILN